MTDKIFIQCQQCGFQFELSAAAHSSSYIEKSRAFAGCWAPGYCHHPDSRALVKRQVAAFKKRKEKGQKRRA